MANLIGDTPNASTAGVLGKSTNDTPAAGPGVHGVSDSYGVKGESSNWHGVAGFSKSTAGGAGVYGKGLSGNFGVLGESTTGAGVEGRSQTGPGVFAQSDAAGVWGKSKTWHGVFGETPSTTGGAGVWGEHKAGGTGVVGKSTSGVGVWGVSETHEGVHAETKSPQTAAIAAYNLNPNGTGAAIFAKKEGGKGHAGFFDGNVWVSGELSVGKDIILANADCAEDFDVSGAAKVEPGTVMVLGDEGALFESQQAYDKRVAGVISGAGDYKPGIVMDKRQSQGNRQPIALMGKVFCKADAQFGAIEVGDLLTTSATPGHAMKAGEPLQAFGAVIGKALRPLKDGQGLIPILIALQ